MGGIPGEPATELSDQLASIGAGRLSALEQFKSRESIPPLKRVISSGQRTFGGKRRRQLQALLKISRLIV
jgi:hypothetical protein